MPRNRLSLARRATALALFAPFALFALFAAGSASAAGDAAAGKATFTTVCMSCHGETGKGDGVVGAMLKPPPRDFSKADFKFDANGDGTAGTDADLALVIKKGAAGFKDASGAPGSALMAPNPGLSDDDIANLIAFIRSLKE